MMQDYKKLVKALRYCAETPEEEKDCNLCDYYPKCSDVIAKEAAAAIEELSAQLADKDYLIQQQWDEIQRLKADVKRQQEKMIELAKKFPKRGEWKRIDKHTVQCPLCHRYLDLRGVNAGRGDANYCPNCGAKMEVQDADT